MTYHELSRGAGAQLLSRESQRLRIYHHNNAVKATNVKQSQLLRATRLENEMIQQT